jgi:hypothetical protein
VPTPNVSALFHNMVAPFATSERRLMSGTSGIRRTEAETPATRRPAKRSAARGKR